MKNLTHPSHPGEGSRITGFPADGLATAPGDFSFGPDIVDAEPGIYRACWQRGVGTATADFFVVVTALKRTVSSLFRW